MKNYSNYFTKKKYKIKIFIKSYIAKTNKKNKINVNKTFQIFKIKYNKTYCDKNPRKKVHKGKADNINKIKTKCQLKQRSADI